MTKDKALEELFLAQQPHFDDHADFMAALAHRLDAVEYVRQHQEATLRRYKLAMVATFVVGLVSGAVTLLSCCRCLPMCPVHRPCPVGALAVACPELPPPLRHCPRPVAEPRYAEHHPQRPRHPAHAPRHFIEEYGQCWLNFSPKYI